MYKNLTLIFLCFMSLNCYSQELRLSKKKKEKTFKEGSLFEIVIEKTNNSDDKRWCGYTELVGKLISISEGSLTLQLSSYTNKTAIENVKIEDIFHSQAGTIEATIAQNEIIYLSNYKSHKHKKRKESFFVTGGLLVFTGLVTALNSFVVRDKSSKKDLLISGGIQLGLGIGFSIAGKSKKYYLSNSQDIWTINK